MGNTKQPFSKFKAAMLPSKTPAASPGAKLNSKPPHQSSGLAGIKPRKRNNPLKAALTSLPANTP